ncbi:hypothetical protein [Porticoccus sp.]
MLKTFRKITAAIALSTLLLAASAQGAEVIGHGDDNTGGQVSGGFSLFLIGGAAGGPLGAIAGGLLGAWAGGEAQQQAGLSGDRYAVRTEQGETLSFRSPNRQFAIGDRVNIDGIRLQPAH